MTRQQRLNKKRTDFNLKSFLLMLCSSTKPHRRILQAVRAGRRARR